MSAPLSSRQVLVFWLPLAGTWLMMAVEGPFLAAIIARLENPTVNLAAYGVAWALALIVEAPVIMLMSAVTALAIDRQSFLALRRFAYALSAIMGGVMLVLLAPPVFHVVSERWLGLPADVAAGARAAIALLVPWPAAIGYRRFYQGLLIRHGYTRWVAYGTAVRVVTMGATALLLAGTGWLTGAALGGASLSAGVIAEALMARTMAGRLFGRLASDESPAVPLSLGAIVEFYVPLALTSVLAMAVQPIVTFFMGQSRMGVASLAVLPAITGLTFLFRSLGISYQEVGIALLHQDRARLRTLSRFAGALGAATTVGLGSIAFTPAAAVWLRDVAGLPGELATLAVEPLRILTPLPGLTVLLALQRALLLSVRRTPPITWATGVEIGAIVLALVTGIRLGWIGVVAAAWALVLGRFAGNLTLLVPCLHAVGSLPVEQGLVGERGVTSRQRLTRREKRS